MFIHVPLNIILHWKACHILEHSDQLSASPIIKYKMQYFINSFKTEQYSSTQ